MACCEDEIRISLVALNRELVAINPRAGNIAFNRRMVDKVAWRRNISVVEYFPYDGFLLLLLRMQKK